MHGHAVVKQCSTQLGRSRLAHVAGLQRWSRNKHGSKAVDKEPGEAARREDAGNVMFLLKSGLVLVDYFSYSVLGKVLP